MRAFLVSTTSHEYQWRDHNFNPTIGVRQGKLHTFGIRHTFSQGLALAAPACHAQGYLASGASLNAGRHGWTSPLGFARGGQTWHTLRVSTRASDMAHIDVAGVK